VKTEPDRAAISSSAPSVCPVCKLEVGETDVFCRRCGRKLKTSATWYYEPIWVWMLGLFILGALAIPLAWLSPKMSRLEKSAFTLVVTTLTAILMILCYLIFAYLWHSVSAINEAGSLLGY